MSHNKTFLLSLLCVLTGQLSAVHSHDQLCSAANPAYEKLLESVKNGDEATVAALLQAQRFTLEALHNTLAEAVSCQNSPMTELLVKNKAPLSLKVNSDLNNINAKKNGAMNSLVAEKIGSKGTVELFDILVKKSQGSKESRDFFVRSSFYLATLNGKYGIIKYILDPKNNFAVDPNSFADDCGNPLLIITTNNHLKKTTKALLDGGANINIKNFEGKTALHVACYEGEPPLNKNVSSDFLAKRHDNFNEIVDLLLQKHPNLQSADKNGFLPIHSAVIGGNVVTVEKIIELSEKEGSLEKTINKQQVSDSEETNSKRTPLMWASRMTCAPKKMIQHDKNTTIALANLLLSHGADSTIPDKTGYSADYWFNRNHIQIKKPLQATSSINQN